MDKRPRGVLRNGLSDPSKLKRARELRQVPTLAESLLWERLRRNQLGDFAFRRQQVVFGFIADFYCNSARLIIELDGAVHDSQVEADQERTSIIQAHGLRVIRFRNDDVEKDIDLVCRIIHEECMKSLNWSDG